MSGEGRKNATIVKSCCSVSRAMLHQKEKNIWWGANMRLADPTIALHLAGFGARRMRFHRLFHVGDTGWCRGRRV